MTIDFKIDAKGISQPKRCSHIDRSDLPLDTVLEAFKSGKSIKRAGNFNTKLAKVSLLPLKLREQILTNKEKYEVREVDGELYLAKMIFAEVVNQSKRKTIYREMDDKGYQLLWRLPSSHAHKAVLQPEKYKLVEYKGHKFVPKNILKELGAV